MKNIIGATLLTTIISTLAATAASAWWSEQHAPRFAKVDVVGLFEEQKAVLQGSVKAGMSKEELERLLETAKGAMAKMDAAVGQLATECGCAVLNAAAIVKLPSKGDGGVPDMTDRVRAILAGT